MVDTLKVVVPPEVGVVVERRAKLELVPARVDMKTGERVVFYLAKQVGGGYLGGASAYYNSKETGIGLRLDRHGASIRFSLPRVYSGKENIMPVDAKGAVVALKRVEEHLKGVGVYIPDLLAEGTNKLSRVDLFRNVEARFPFRRYAVLFRALSGKWVKRNEYGGEGFLWHNRSRQCVCYDKVREMKAKGWDTERYRGKNILRVEVRNTRARVIRRNLSFSDCAGLIRDWDSLPERYKEQLRSLVFVEKEASIDRARDVWAAGEVERMRYFVESCPRGFHSYFKAMGIERSLEVFGSLDRLEEAIREVSPSRQTARRIVGMVRETALTTPTIKVGEGVSLADLYQELWEKLIAA